jgi:hypothetical protein
MTLKLHVIAHEQQQIDCCESSLHAYDFQHQNQLCGIDDNTMTPNTVYFALRFETLLQKAALDSHSEQLPYKYSIIVDINALKFSTVIHVTANLNSTRLNMRSKHLHHICGSTFRRLSLFMSLQT